MDKPQNFTAISKKYGPGYVARMKNSLKVIASAKRVDTLFKKIRNKKEFKEDKVVIDWVPKYGQQYALEVSIQVRKH